MHACSRVCVCEVVGGGVRRSIRHGTVTMAGACSAMGTGGTCTPQKFSIWVIVMYANMLLNSRNVANKLPGGGLPSAPVHPPSWGAEHAPVWY